MQRGRAIGRGRMAAAGLWGLAALAWGLSLPAHAAGPELGFENLRVGFANNSRPNMYKVGTWAPVWVQIRGGAERFSGVLEIETPDDDGTPTFVRKVVDVGPRESPRVVTYIRPGGRLTEIKIRLRNERGRVAASADGSSLAQIDPVLPDEAVLLTLGKPQGVDQVPQLPGFTGDPKNGGGEVITVGRFDDNAFLPGNWYGYDAAEAVVLDTNDKEMMQGLTVRGQALVDWVRRGGHLVVAVGANWQEVRDSVLGPILPALPTGQEQVNTLSGLETFAGATKPILPPASGRVSVAKLEQADERGGKVLAAVGAVPLVVRGAHGFGRVTLVGVDVDQRPFSEWPERALFWVKAIDIRRPSADATNAVRIVGGGRRLYQAGVSDLSSQLRAALEQFPGVKLVPFGWVAFFIFLYILLIGPGDYFFLKKVVKRMELTWVTFPLIVLSVSVAAYIAAYAVKGRELRVNKIDVVDVDAAAGVARGSSFLNVFSPQNRDYNVAVVPQALDRPPTAEAPAWTSSGPPQLPVGTEMQLSWLGVPEPGFGGMTSTRVGFSGSGYSYDPVGGFERIEGLRIPIWSTKALSARWFGPSAPLVEADLIPVGSDRLSGTVTNRLDVAFQDAVLAFGKQVYQLGTLAPGATVRVELTADRQLSGLLKSQSGGYLPDQVWHNQQAGRINRTNLMLAVMFHDSQGTTVDRVLSSDPLRYLDLTGQLGLDRPMLVGRVDRPASRLALENAPAAPMLEETTIVRVILPLSQNRGQAQDAAPTPSTTPAKPAG